jgi:GGDEF domain-containing protein
MLYEYMSASRIIRINAKHPDDLVPTYMGDSVGRWEGDTFVVDVTNYNGKGWIATNAAAGRMRGILQSDALHVVERFSRVSASTIHYEVTIDDPKMYTRPWKVAIPLERDDDYRIFEYACHEGNHAVENVLRSARALESGPR